MRDLRQNRGDVFDDLASERGRQRRPKIGWIHAHVRRDNPLSI
jgi:hypothetical protein